LKKRNRIDEEIFASVNLNENIKTEEDKKIKKNLKSKSALIILL
jgi:hypothetical protein